MGSAESTESHVPPVENSVWLRHTPSGSGAPSLRPDGQIVGGGGGGGGGGVFFGGAFLFPLPLPLVANE